MLKRFLRWAAPSEMPRGATARSDAHTRSDPRLAALTEQARKLAAAGKQARAYKAYRSAADLAPSDPQLQLRTAELARALAEHELAIQYYRRAARAYAETSSPKQAAAALHHAWAIAHDALPKTVALLVDVAQQLAETEQALGFRGEASELIFRTEQALKQHGHGGTAARLDSGSGRVATESEHPPSSLSRALPNAPKAAILAAMIASRRQNR